MRDLVYRLEGIRHTYDGRQVLRVDELDILAGEVLALVGPSGAGKSTLLRLLGFLEPPDAGTVFYRSTPFRAGSPVSTSLRRRVTMVFQQPYLLNRSVIANVEYGLRLRQVSDRRQLAERMLGAVGLSSIARQPARSLSGGEAQRVAMARALVLKPDVLLLDEPTANLDPRNVSLLEDIVVQANRDRGTTIVLVTHNIFQARRMADRIGFLLEGQLAEVAEAETFFRSPSDPRAAAFVAGEMIY